MNNRTGSNNCRNSRASCKCYLRPAGACHNIPGYDDMLWRRRRYERQFSERYLGAGRWYYHKCGKKKRFLGLPPRFAYDLRQTLPICGVCHRRWKKFKISTCNYSLDWLQRRKNKKVRLMLSFLCSMLRENVDAQTSLLVFLANGSVSSTRDQRAAAITTLLRLTSYVTLHKKPDSVLVSGGNGNYFKNHKDTKAPTQTHTAKTKSLSAFMQMVEMYNKTEGADLTPHQVSSHQCQGSVGPPRSRGPPGSRVPSPGSRVPSPGSRGPSWVHLATSASLNANNNTRTGWHKPDFLTFSHDKHVSGGFDKPKSVFGRSLSSVVRNPLEISDGVTKMEYFGCGAHKPNIRSSSYLYSPEYSQGNQVFFTNCHTSTSTCGTDASKGSISTTTESMFYRCANNLAENTIINLMKPPVSETCERSQSEYYAKRKVSVSSQHIGCNVEQCKLKVPVRQVVACVTTRPDREFIRSIGKAMTEKSHDLHTEVQYCNYVALPLISTSMNTEARKREPQQIEYSTIISSPWSIEHQESVRSISTSTQDIDKHSSVQSDNNENGKRNVCVQYSDCNLEEKQFNVRNPGYVVACVSTRPDLEFCKSVGQATSETFPAVVEKLQTVDAEVQYCEDMIESLFPRRSAWIGRSHLLSIIPLGSLGDASVQTDLTYEISTQTDLASKRCPMVTVGTSTCHIHASVSTLVSRKQSQTTQVDPKIDPVVVSKTAKESIDIIAKIDREDEYMRLIGESSVAGTTLCLRRMEQANALLPSPRRLSTTPQPANILPLYSNSISDYQSMVSQTTLMVQTESSVTNSSFPVSSVPCVTNESNSILSSYLDADRWYNQTFSPAKTGTVFHSLNLKQSLSDDNHSCTCAAPPIVYSSSRFNKLFKWSVPGTTPPIISRALSGLGIFPSKTKVLFDKSTSCIDLGSRTKEDGRIGDCSIATKSTSKETTFKARSTTTLRRRKPEPTPSRCTRCVKPAAPPAFVPLRVQIVNCGTQVSPNRTDTATLKVNECMSVGVVTSRCFLPRSGCQSQYNDNNIQDCVLVYDRPRCLTHKSVANIAIQMRPTLLDSKLTRTPETDSDNSAVLSDRILSPKEYKALYHTSKLVEKGSKYYSQQRNGVALTNSDKNSDQARMSAGNLTSPCSIERILACPGCNQRREMGTDTEMMEKLKEFGTQLEDTSSVSIDRATSDCLCSKDDCQQSKSGSEEDDGDKLMQNSDQMKSSISACNSNVSPSASIQGSGFCNDIATAARGAGHQRGGRRKDGLQCVGAMLAGSCQYYSALMQARIWHVLSKAVKPSEPPIDESWCELNFLEVATMKPTARVELAVQTNDNNIQNKNSSDVSELIRSCRYLDLAAGRTEINRGQVETLRTVYYFLAAIEGRIRRLRYNMTH